MSTRTSAVQFIELEGGDYYAKTRPLEDSVLLRVGRSGSDPSITPETTIILSPREARRLAVVLLETSLPGVDRY